MAATEQSFSLDGDLTFATNILSIRSLVSFRPAIKCTKSGQYTNVIPTGTVDLVVNLQGITKVTWYLLLIDAATDGKIDLRVNDADVTKEVSLMDASVGTDITSLKISNDSGNDAGVSLWFGGE
jgi:hypothetical protein